MKKNTLFLVSLFITFSLSATPSYRNSWARYILADIYLGGTTDYYEQHSSDPNSSRALRWFKAGVTIRNLDQFERKQFEEHVIRIVYKGSNTSIAGDELILSTDQLYDEGKVRYILTDIGLGADTSYYLNQKENTEAIEAMERWKDRVKVSNLYKFERKKVIDTWYVVYKGTGITINPAAVTLTVDEGWYEDEARYILADIALGGNVAYYDKRYTQSRDPSIYRALQYVKDSVKIKNLNHLERKLLADKKAIVVYHGTNTRISGENVELSSDAKNDAELRCIMADVALGGSLDFYKGETNNASVRQMLKVLEAGERVMNACDFERKTFTDNGTWIVRKGTRKRITGEEVILSSDLAATEAPVRYYMALMLLNKHTLAPVPYPNNMLASLAMDRINRGIKITNLDKFVLTNSEAEQSLVLKGSNKPVRGIDIILNTDRYYDEQNVRLIMATLSLGARQDEYLKKEDPDSREAVRRIKENVTVKDTHAFEKKTIAGSSALFYKGTDVTVNPEDVFLSSDSVDKEYQIREVMLKKRFGLKQPKATDNYENELWIQAEKRLKDGVTVKNKKDFKLKSYKGRGNVIENIALGSRAKSYDIYLSSDKACFEGEARYILADIALGGPAALAFYANVVRHGAPVALEPYTRWKEGVRVANLSNFERKLVPRLGWKIVYAGTNDVINPMDVKLTK